MISRAAMTGRALATEPHPTWGPPNPLEIPSKRPKPLSLVGCAVYCCMKTMSRLRQPGQEGT